MNRSIKNRLLLATSIMLLFSCSKMDSTYKELIDGSQTKYIGKVTEVVSYPGKNRVLLAWNKLSDPRITEIEISWKNGQEKLRKTIKNSKDTCQIIPNLEEGSYSFTLQSFDESGNNSLVSTVNAEAYGDQYQSMLANRLVKKIKKNSENSITIEFIPSSNTEFRRQDLIYTSTSGETTTLEIASTENNLVTVSDYNSESFKLVSYYKPYEIDFDMFGSPEVIEYTPSVPHLFQPLNNLSGISCCPRFEWKPILGQENVIHTIRVSEDQLTWIDFPITAQEAFTPRTTLKANTTYYWKIECGAISSEIRNFTTGAKDYYGDREIVPLMAKTIGTKASNFVIIGDGFNQIEHKINRMYDKAVKEVVDILFNTLPYKSYKEYFNVYQLNAYSSKTGIDDTKSTALGSVYDKNTNEVKSNKAKIDAYLKDLSLEPSELDNTCVVVIVNTNLDAPSITHYDGGLTVAVCPTFANTDHMPYYDFKYTALRYAGGFGYGLLESEVSSIDAITPEKADELKALWTKGRGLNLDLVDPSNPEAPVRWQELIGKPSYDAVGKMVGGYGFGEGVLRSENNSTMDNTRSPRFNAASRMAIVKRIKSIAAESFTIEDFITKDK